jgi:hypothetical protein
VRADREADPIMKVDDPIHDIKVLRSLPVVAFLTEGAAPLADDRACKSRA